MRMHSTGRETVSLGELPKGKIPAEQSEPIEVAYPHNSQCHLRHPEPPLNIPILSHTTDNCRRPPLPSHARPDMQQLSQEGKSASQPPPSGGQCAQGPTDQQRDIPPAVHPQNDSHTGVQGRGSCLASITAERGMQRGGSLGWWDESRRSRRRSHFFGSGLAQTRRRARIGHNGARNVNVHVWLCS